MWKPQMAASDTSQEHVAAYEVLGEGMAAQGQGKTVAIDYSDSSSACPGMVVYSTAHGAA